MSNDDLINNFPKVFAEGIGTIKDNRVSVKLCKDAKPVCMWSQTDPFALRKSVDLERDRLVSEGFIKQIYHQE